MTDFYVDGKKAVTAEAHFMSESFVWFRFIMEDGQKIETLPLKGEI
jgi:hypothetical protein